MKLRYQMRRGIRGCGAENLSAIGGSLRRTAGQRCLVGPQGGPTWRRRMVRVGAAFRRPFFDGRMMMNRRLLLVCALVSLPVASLSGCRQAPALEAPGLKELQRTSSG